MSLILHALSNTKDPPASDPTMTHEFKQQSGSIGRSQNNDWVLADTHKYLSGQHARIEYRDHHYILTDTSTNGVFHNHATQAIGKGRAITLNDGDTLRMGIYDIEVSIRTSSNPDQPLSSHENTSSSDPFADISDEFCIDNAVVQDASIDADDPFQDMWQDDFIASDTPEKSALPTADVIEDHFQPLSVQADTSYGSNQSPHAVISNKEFAYNNDPFANKSEHSNEKNVNETWDDGWFTDSKNHSVDSNSNSNSNPDITSKTDEPTDNKGVHANKQADESWDEDWFQQTTESNAADIDDFFMDTKTEASKREESIQRKAIKSPDDNKYTAVAEAVVTSKPITPIVVKVADPASAIKNTASIAAKISDSASLVKNKAQINLPVNNSQNAMQQFLAGLQLDDEDLEKKVLENLDFKQVGALFKISIQGTLDILHSRTHIKNEMRMDVTTIQPIENNPLKFSITADEALVRLLVPQKNSYLAPKDALEEAYNDIRAHQMAVISGIQATLSYMLKRFEPKKLTTRLQKKSPIAAVIPLHRKAKLWALFEDLYDTLQEEAEDDFNRLFSLEFSKAYDQQIDYLKQQMSKGK